MGEVLSVSSQAVSKWENESALPDILILPKLADFFGISIDELMGYEAQISMEEKMACGIGACLACVCKSKEVDHHTNVNNKRICKDGPVFDAREVEF